MYNTPYNPCRCFSTDVTPYFCLHGAGSFPGSPIHILPLAFCAASSILSRHLPTALSCSERMTPEISVPIILRQSYDYVVYTIGEAYIASYLLLH